MKPAFDLARVDAATDAAMAAGHRVFQTHLYAPDDEGHVAVLLDYLGQVPPYARIVDAGCGIGEVSRIMARRLPHATFIMVNLSAHQLGYCPQGPRFIHILGDCHRLASLAEVRRGVDAIMFSSALCQMDAPVVLAECAKVLPLGGTLLLNELVRPSWGGGGNTLLEEHLACRVLDSPLLADMLAHNGFTIQRMETPHYDDSHFRGLLRTGGIEAGLDNVLPCVIQAIRTA